MLPMLDHRLLLHQREQDPLRKTPDRTGSGTQIQLGPVSEDKAHGSFIPHIALWHCHSAGQKYLEMTEAPEQGSHHLHFHPLNVFAQPSTRSLKKQKKVRNKFLLSKSPDLRDIAASKQWHLFPMSQSPAFTPISM